MKKVIVILFLSFTFLSIGFAEQNFSSDLTGPQQSAEYANYVAPDGTYQCTYSTFPGIFPGTVATWYNNVWTVNGVSYTGGAAGMYSPIQGGFKWTNGLSTCKWRKIR